MEEIKSVAEDAITQCQRVLGKHGRLSTAIPGFVAREAQISLAAAIAEIIESKSILVAEAGTGTGKTFAYLIPCLLSGKKTVISTATKTLQDQLFHKDLPTLMHALGLSVRVQNLKGRANYICRHRLLQHTEEGQFPSARCVSDLIHIREKLPRLLEGERAELTEISEDSPVWPYATSTVENCLGTECEHYQNCFLVKARRKALDANLIVINHHLFFADSRLKEEGFGELLPGVDVIIFDEAHQLAEIATNFQGERLGTRQLRDRVDELLKEWPALDLASSPMKTLSLDLDTILADLLSCFSRQEERQSWQEAGENPVFQPAWQRLMDLLDSIINCVEQAGLTDEAAVQRTARQLGEYRLLARRFNQRDKDYIFWLERYRHSLIFYATPLNIAESFSSLLAKQQCASVFTSATLTMASSFDSFLKPLGLQGARTLLLPSPFNYQQQVLLYLPRDLPDPKDLRYNAALAAKAIPIINACGGRCFFLFTSHKALKEVAVVLANILNYPLLIQGEEAKPILLERFRKAGNAVLLGTATFWEGVDVKGEALSCVIIDKLPFTSPADPVMKGKMAYLKSQGLSGFDELSLPDAVLALKQGVGRLIRDDSDRGVLMIADPRLTGRDYGARIFASLPLMRKTREEAAVLNFINELALENESVSD